MQKLIFTGRWQYRLGSFLLLLWASWFTSLRRLFKGPELPEWSWGLEAANAFVKLQQRTATRQPDIRQQREYFDALVFGSPVMNSMKVEAAEGSPVRARWFTPPDAVPGRVMLYLHGGGYAFFAKLHDNMIALIADAARARVLAIDYRLIPEHPYPAQLEDALAAYRWLLDCGVSTHNLIVAGDSAGGNLTATLILSLRDQNLPLPALGILICPWTDVGNSGASMDAARHDWVTGDMPREWATWLLKNGADARDPLVSPLYADLRGIPPLYIQAGDQEILYDQICAFYEHARAQGAPVTLEIWKNMVHDFQAYGDVAPEAVDALRRIGEIIDQTTGKPNG